MSFTLDPALRRFATDRQWELLQALETHGSRAAAAKALGCASNLIQQAHLAVRTKAAKHGFSPEHDMTHTVPDGYQVKGTSTLYRTETGEPVLQWVKSSIDQQRQEELFRAAIEAMTGPLPRLEPTAPPKQTSDKLMACYPVGDHHLGMLSWKKETDANYDLEIGEKLLADATDHLIKSVPACDHAALVFLGDFMHYDSFETVTPTSRNMLDSDTRYPILVRAAIRSMRRMIETALKWHREVRVIVEIGNHDLASSIFLMECLRNVYEKEPRITIDTSPKHYHYFDFGNVLVGTHHGHGTNMKNLPLIMATDKPTEWGRTKYRYWWTGHIHTSKVQAAMSAQDFSGCSVESFRVLAPVDAWAHQKGYRSIRDMKAIVLHKEFGEVARHIVNPAMF